MWCVVATEFMLFVCMFGAYYYLGNNKNRWTIETPPSLKYPLMLLVILLISSIVLRWGEHQVKRGRLATARSALWVTVLIGLLFMAVQCLEYIEHWKTLTPYSDSYGSIFYSITTLHAAHVIAGLLMLGYVGFLPRYADTVGSPHRVYETVALYWHFIDFVWIVIVALLYILPNIQGYAHGR